MRADLGIPVLRALRVTRVTLRGVSERVTKSIRLSPEEWAAVEAAAGPMAPATWMREAVLFAARGGQGVVVAAPAALVKPEMTRWERRQIEAIEADARARAVPPVESAGSAAVDLLPSAGAPAAPDPSSSAGSAPASRGRRLVEVVAAGLASSRGGARADDGALAMAMVEGGKVVVDGLVAIDPDQPIVGGEEIEVR